MTIVLDQEGVVEIHKNIFCGLFDVVKSQVRWEQQYLDFFGRSTKIPRLTSWMSDEGHSYTYSNIQNQAFPFPPSILQIKEHLEELTGQTFNSCLGNFYRDNKDSVSWHSDDEKELGKNPYIASVSLGETRKFSVKNKKTKVRHDFHLEDGDILLMYGPFQEHWLHQVPKTRKPLDSRINLTFRRFYK